MPLAVKISFIAVLFFLILLSAFFSASETAYTSLSRAKLEEEIKSGHKSALMIRKHIHKFGRTLATVLIGNTLVNIGASSLITYLFTELMGASGTTTLVSTVIMTPILVIFGEITPKLLAKRHPLKYLKLTVYIIEILSIIFYPLTFPISKMTLSSKVTNTETDLLNLIKVATKEGVLEVSEATLAKNALELDSTKISEEMTKKKDFVYIESGAKISEAKQIFKNSGHSRVPVLSGKEFTHILLLKDIVFEDGDGTIENFTKEAFFISKNVLLSKALEQLRFHKTHLALVTESSKSRNVIGLITLEDIVESLIGEIYDEHDKTQAVSEIALYKWTILGSVSMQDVVRETKMKVELSDLDLTLKEFLQAKINRRIKKGLKYTYKNQFLFRVISNKKGKETVIEITRK